MAYTSIDDPAIYFNTKLYTGNGSTQSITLDGDENMQPDLVYFKQRTGSPSSSGSQFYDVVRGATKYLSTHSTNAEATQSNGLTSFDSDGFSIGNTSRINGNTESYVAWNWKAGTAFSNDASATSIGSIDSSGSVNETAGFSICSFTGTGSTATIKHGLSTAPSMLIFKNRETTDSWNIQHDGLTSYDYYVRLNSTGAQNNDIDVGPTTPTSSVIEVGSHDQQNGSGDDMIAYCFAEKQGYSKFGSYTGNGNADGAFVYTGFKPAWLLIKKSSASGNGWFLMDTKTNTYNPKSIFFQADLSNAETDVDRMDILSNGFKPRYDWGIINESGASYIYMAFAEQPFVNSNGVPCNAR